MQEINQQRFVNVDMYSAEGLKRAKALNLASSGVPDIFISNMLLDTLEVFNNREFLPQNMFADRHHLTLHPT